MNESEAKIHEALRRFGREPIPVVDPEVAEMRERRGVATLTRAIESARRERSARRRVRVLGAWCAAAALVLGVIGGVHRLAADRSEGAWAEEMTVVRGTVRVVNRAGTGEELRAGDRVEADGVAEIELGRTTRVRLEPGAHFSVLTLEEDAQRLLLDRGRVSFEVDPTRSSTVVVETRSAWIRVVGTYFHVTSGRADDAAGTDVEVERGVVEVHDATTSLRLGPGERWSSPQRAGLSHARADERETSAPKIWEADASDEEERVESGSNAAERPSAPAKTEAAKTGPAKAEAAETERAKARSSAATTLGEEIRAYQGALAARNAGDDARAAAELALFLARHPSSPLRQEAFVERFRALARLGQRTEAAAVARRYLAAYPEGFARREAGDVALPGAPSP